MNFTIKHDKEADWFVIYNKAGKAVDAQRTLQLAKFVVEHLLNKGL